jgi:hypothetical protein
VADGGHLYDSRVRRCRSRPCRVVGLQGASRPQELCAGTLPDHDAGRCGTGRHRRACGAGNRVGGAVSVTAPIPAVRGQAFSCPWLAGSRDARTCSGWWWPQTCLVARIRWSARLTRVEGERSVKPSAQPTLVRTQHLPQHLPHPAKTPRWLRILVLAGRFFSVPACVTLGRCRPSCCGVHGRIADGRPCCLDGRCAPSAFPRTATDGPRQRSVRRHRRRARPR